MNLEEEGEMSENNNAKSEEGRTKYRQDRHVWIVLSNYWLLLLLLLLRLPLLLYFKQTSSNLAQYACEDT